MGEEFQTWKQHFINQARGLIPHQRKFYKVSLQEGGGEQPRIKMVSPTEQIVERAKATLEQPPSVYDPVTGVMQQTSGKHIKARRPRKRKGAVIRRINNKKRKVVRKKKKPTRKSKPNKKGGKKKQPSSRKSWW